MYAIRSYYDRQPLQGLEAADRRQRPLIAEHDLRAAPGQQTAQGHPAFAGADDDDLLPNVIAHRYLSFRVDSATRARMMLMIQKRTMIFGSGHPLSSKWW